MKMKMGVGVKPCPSFKGDPDSYSTVVQLTPLLFSTNVSLCRMSIINHIIVQIDNKTEIGRETQNSVILLSSYLFNSIKIKDFCLKQSFKNANPVEYLS